MSRKLLYLPLLAVLLQSSLFAILKRGPISMELVSEQKTVVDGKAFWLGWRIIREKGWHTYWKHPGDVGVPPKIEWMVPDGFKVGELIYALPQRVSMGKVKAHGNYGETLFLCKFESSVPLESGMLLEISGKASWIWRPRFEAFRESMPRDAPANWTFQAFRNGDKIDLMLPPSVRETGGYPYLFGHGRLIRSHAPQVLRKGKNGWLLSLRRTTWGTGKEREISGLLYRKEGWGKVSFGNYLQIRVPLQ
jgi:hypothetical protein